MTFSTGWIMWSRGRQVIFLESSTPATQVAMKVTWVSPGDECGPKELAKWRKRGGPVMLISFLWLGPPMLQQSPAISFAVFVARKSLSWLMVTTSFCDTSRTATISHATNNWGWEMLDYEGNAMNTAEVEQQLERILRAPLVVRDR